MAIGSSSGTTVEAANSQSIAGAGLPQGAVALVGQVGYTVSGVPVGGTADVTLELPPGSDPTAVYKLVNGSYVKLGPMASIDGDQITLHLTDGGPGDEDGVANGVIVDPLVPVRVTSPPEIGRCLSVPNGTGARSSSKCTTAGGKKGYEWFPAVGSAKPIGRGGLNLTTSAAAVLEGISRQAITCGEAHLSAADEGLKSLGHAEVVLEGCRRGASETCQSRGEASGYVITHPLRAELGTITTSATAAKNKLGFALQPAGETTLADFACGVTQMSLRGSVIGEVKANAMGTAVSLKFGQSKGVQKPGAFAGGASHVLQMKTGSGAYEAAGLSASFAGHAEEAIEISSVL